MKKKIPAAIIISVILLFILSYLFFSYTGFYRYVGDVSLKSPYMHTSFSLDNSKGDGSIKYAALGDSLSVGVGSDNVTETFVYQYALKLSKKYKKVDILNLAVSGDTTDDVITEQLSNAVEFKPDIISLLIGTNDLHNKVTDSDFQKNYEFILSELLTKTDAQIMVLNIPYLGSDKIVHPPYTFLLEGRTKEFNEIILNVVSNLDKSGRIRYMDLIFLI